MVRGQIMTDEKTATNNSPNESSSNKLHDWQGPLLVLSIVIIAVCSINLKFFRVEPQKVCDPINDTADHCAAQQFKYGTLGGEVAVGIPFRIFTVLPKVFGVDGYEAFGFRYELECDKDACSGDQCDEKKACHKKRDLPVGFSKSRMGYERVTVNCALCHVTSYRLPDEQAPRLFIGGPAHTVDIQAFLEFLNRVAHSNQHDDEILEAIEGLGWLDRVIYKWRLIPRTRAKLRAQAKRFAWIHDGEPSNWGPGRSDPINRIKAEVIGIKKDDSAGQTDFPDIWSLGQRRDRAIFWGGEMRSIDGALIDHALAIGAPPGPETVQRLKDIRDLMSVRQPPRYPKKFAIDQKAVAKGRKLFRDYCTKCHGWNGKHSGGIVPINVIGTDSSRFNAWSEQHADAMNSAIIGLGIEREPMVKTKGYVAPALHGLWLRAPYLHNGSVPTLWDLLTPPEDRPRRFIKGIDILDLENVGFLAPECDPKDERGYCFNTEERGNGKGGHDYGTSLPDEEKRQLIEYLKTL